jgi:hypothetical protein
MCREEIKWALEAGIPILPVVAAADKLKIGDFIAEGQTHGLDFGSFNFVHLDRSGPLYLEASLATILVQMPLPRPEEPQAEGIDKGARTARGQAVAQRRRQDARVVDGRAAEFGGPPNVYQPLLKPAVPGRRAVRAPLYRVAAAPRP